nr:hypothetical protein [Rhizobiaceae bacterium]
VISEMSWFTDAPPPEAKAFWDEAYPAMASEADNFAHARAAGLDVLLTRRLPSQAWWDNYYGPLGARCDALAPTATDAMAAVIADTRREMELFRRHCDAFGYTFYVLRR